MVMVTSSTIDCDVITRTKIERVRHGEDDVCTRVLFWCLFRNIQQNNTLMSAKTFRHSSTYIFLYVNDEAKCVWDFSWIMAEIVISSCTDGLAQLDAKTSANIATIAVGSRYDMMTSSNGNIFRVTGYRWIPLAKASDAELSLICAWIYSWVSNREPGGLRRHRAHIHYDVIIMDKKIYHMTRVSQR